MADIRDLIPQTVRDHTIFSAGIWWGYVCKLMETTAAPIPVVIPDISRDLVWDCMWTKVGTTPPVGSEVLVVFDNRQHPWVLAIWTH